MAQLVIKQGLTMSDKQKQYVTLIASNGEPLMHGEMLVNPQRGRNAIIDAMVDVLRGEGYEVVKS